MTSEENEGPVLVLGPMLRYAGETEATVWVETDRECLVEILGRQARTFEVAGHHYGLVVLDGLTPGSEHGVHGHARRHGPLAARRRRVPAERAADAGP